MVTYCPELTLLVLVASNIRSIQSCIHSGAHSSDYFTIRKYSQYGLNLMKTHLWYACPTSFSSHLRVKYTPFMDTLMSFCKWSISLSLSRSTDLFTQLIWKRLNLAKVSVNQFHRLICILSVFTTNVILSEQMCLICLYILKQ